MSNAGRRTSGKKSGDQWVLWLVGGLILIGFLALMALGALGIVLAFNAEKIEQALNELSSRLDESESDEGLYGAYDLDAQEKYEYRMHIGDLFMAEDFDRLESIVEGLRREKDRFPAGDWKLEFFYRGLLYESPGIELQDTDAYLAVIKAWRQAKPHSITPVLVEAQAHIYLAWEARGDGYSDDVGEEARDIFKKELNTTLELLAEAEKFAEAEPDPVLYALYLMVDRGLGRQPESQAHFEKGITLEPYFYPLYEQRATHLLPRWHGKAGDAEALARLAVDKTRSGEGEAMYARIAQLVAEYEEPGGFYEETGFAWERIKKGFADWEERYALSSQDLNAYCWLATAAKQRELAAELFERVGDEPSQVWVKRVEFEKWRDWALGKREITREESLLIAVGEGNRDTVAELLQTGADINAKDTDGLTPLITAIEEGHDDLVSLLLAHGADPNLTTKKGWSALQSAANLGKPKIVRQLLEKKAHVNHHDRFGWTPLHVAVTGGSVEAVEAILAQPDVPLNAKTEDGYTALHEAAWRGNAKMVERLLLQPGIEIDSQDNWQRTPLHAAAEEGYDEVIRLLLAKGAEINPRNYQNKTPLHIARRKKHATTVALLKKEGAIE